MFVVHTSNCHGQNYTRRAIFRLGIKTLIANILVDSITDSPPPCIDIVHPGRVWSFSPACTRHCSLHYLFFQATPLFHNGVNIVC